MEREAVSAAVMGNDYFRQALSDFSFELASGGAIRHLADLGYTVKQIQERLDFPTPYARIQEAVWKRLVETGVILLADPKLSKARMEENAGRVDFVREYDRYGKVSFRRVVEPECQRGEQGPYLVCEFGRVRREDAGKYSEALKLLNARAAEYIEGLPWVRQNVWHRADERMLDAERRLREAGLDVLLHR